ncbi:hypothetical protein [Spongiimicrobium salis]|uniref:hypothetical protein n=1 Tax=Spongiimicrobium salis TaxID=1667022 RepID=UPI00374CBCA7
MMYTSKEDQKVSVNIQDREGKIELVFSSNCGKFGTDEILDQYTLKPERLLQILQDRDDYSEGEL